MTNLNEQTPEEMEISASGDAILISDSINYLAEAFLKLADSITNFATAQHGEPEEEGPLDFGAYDLMGKTTLD